MLVASVWLLLLFVILLLLLLSLLPLLLLLFFLVAATVSMNLTLVDLRLARRSVTWASSAPRLPHDLRFWVLVVFRGNCRV